MCQVWFAKHRIERWKVVPCRISMNRAPHPEPNRPCLSRLVMGNNDVQKELEVRQHHNGYRGWDGCPISDGPIATAVSPSGPVSGLTGPTSGSGGALMSSVGPPGIDCMHSRIACHSDPSTNPFSFTNPFLRIDSLLFAGTCATPNDPRCCLVLESHLIVPSLLVSLASPNDSRSCPAVVSQSGPLPIWATLPTSNNNHSRLPSFLGG